MNKLLLARFEVLSLREKLYIVAAVLASLWMGLDNFYLQPIAQQQKQLRKEIHQINAQLNELVIAKAEIQAQGKFNPNQKNTQTLSHVKAHLKQLKKNVQFGNKHFVEPESMTLVLAELLNEDYGLQLIRAEKLPVKSLTEQKQEKSWVFQHGLSLTFSGNYQNTLRYLQAIEASPWRFLWHSIVYKTQEYPTAEVTIKIYTLGFQEHWLRV
ncbi:MAG: hypothetical protein K9L22_00670 [Methylococcaceae bacterium]|nr:hypothetical protein [Methylococcaceae bacterium]